MRQYEKESLCEDHGVNDSIYSCERCALLFAVYSQNVIVCLERLLNNHNVTQEEIDKAVSEYQDEVESIHGLSWFKEMQKAHHPKDQELLTIT